METTINLTDADLENLISKKSARYSELKNYPSTRMSAMGVMIQEAYVIREMEEVYEEIDLIKAELVKRNNKEGEKLFFIVYSTKYYHVVPLITENGIVKKGGLLDNYFIGKSASEHEAYVRGRHNKTLCEVSFLSEDISSNHIYFEIKLNDGIFRFTSDYKISANNPTYFYIEFQNKELERTDMNRGATTKERCALTYAAAYLYQKTFAPNKNINIR